MHLADALRAACVKSAVHETRVFVNADGEGKYDYSISEMFSKNTVAGFDAGTPFNIPKLVSEEA